MKYLIIGGVAAGTKAAAKIKRCDQSAEVCVITKSDDISYAGCGLPYYIGGDIATRDELIVNTPAKFSALTGAQVKTGCEAVALNSAQKTVTVKTKNGEKYDESYDKLVIATGAEPFVPSVDGINLGGVFCVRTPDDAAAILEYIKNNDCRKAVVCGAGFIGLEMAENLMVQKLNVTVIDAAEQIMPNIFDPDMAQYAKKQLKAAGVRVLTNTPLRAVSGDGKAQGVVTDAGTLPTDIVIIAIGIKPATKFLENSGIELVKGAVAVDEFMRTSLPDVYAAGDCALVKNAITGERQWSAMGSTANITARALAKTLTGTPTPYGGCLGTGVVRLLPTLNAGRTGLTLQQAKNAGFDAVSALFVTDDKAHYYPNSASFVVKIIADKASHRLLGLQVLGAGAVDKMTDIAVAGIGKNAKIEDFDTLDFAYAPPFSTAIHPFVTACYIMENKLAGQLEAFTPEEYSNGAAKGYTVLDVQAKPQIAGAKWVDLPSVNGEIDGIKKDEKLLLVCTRGRRAYLLQTRMKALGYTNTRVLEGGTFVNDIKVERVGTKLSEAEIKRVKGLGCLWDKRYDDIFNVRIITRNGKLTSDEQRTVAEAAEKYGSGEVTMTTRLTLEIQGVQYDKIDELMEFVGKAGLETGGTAQRCAPSSHARARRASMASSTHLSCRKSFTSAFMRATTA